MNDALMKTIGVAVIGTAIFALFGYWIVLAIWVFGSQSTDFVDGFRQLAVTYSGITTLTTGLAIALWFGMARISAGLKQIGFHDILAANPMVRSFVAGLPMVGFISGVWLGFKGLIA
jgi:hypothetical protein